MTKSFIILVTILLVVIVNGFFVSAAENTVVLASRLWSRSAEQEFVINEILKPFEEENECTVVFHVFENDDQLLQHVRTQVEANQVTTDVVIAYSAQMQDWVEEGWAVDLTEYVHSWIPQRTFPNGLASMTIFNGKRYFLPIGADVYLLIANKKALKYLPDGVDIQDITWEQVAEWSLAMARGEGEGKYAMTGAPQKMLIYQCGGAVLSYGGGFPIINSPGALQAWEILVSMRDAYTPNILTYESVVEPMKLEEAWLTVAHCARVGGIYRSNPEQFVVAPAPKGSIGIGSITGTSGLAIMEETPHQDLAFKLVEYMTRPEIQLKIAKGTGGFIPPVEEAIELLDESIEDEIIRKALYVMDKGVLAFIPSMFGEKWGEVKLIYEDAFRKLVLEDGVVDKAYLDSAQEEIDRLEVEGLLLKSPLSVR